MKEYRFVRQFRRKLKDGERRSAFPIHIFLNNFQKGIGICVSLPFFVMGGSVWFLVLFFIAYLFRMVVDTAIPAVVTEIIPQNQIGAFTSIRMIVFIGAQAVATLIIMLILGVVGYNGLMIFAAIMQTVCGVGYYLSARFKNGKNNIAINR